MSTLISIIANIDDDFWWFCMILVRNSLDNSENKCSGNPSQPKARRQDKGGWPWDSQVKMNVRVSEGPGVSRDQKEGQGGCQETHLCARFINSELSIWYQYLYHFDQYL